MERNLVDLPEQNAFLVRVSDQLGRRKVRRGGAFDVVGRSRRTKKYVALKKAIGRIGKLAHCLHSKN